jgi:hypothetical protein
MQTALQTESKFFIRIGDRIVNAGNIVSFDLEGSDSPELVCWVRGTADYQAPVPSRALFEVLQARQWLL